MNHRTPVIIAGANYLSGVTSWANQLRTALADHPRYHVQTLYIGRRDNDSAADISVTTLPHAQEKLRELAPVVVLPNYVWPLYLSGLEPGIRCIGMCHADDVTQYYRPLCWYEPAIAKYIAVSKECASNLAQHLGCHSHDIATLPYGVCVPSELQREYQTKPLRLIYAGRVTQPQKRVWDFVPLVEHLLRARVPFVFDIIGGGDEFGPLQHIFSARVPAADVRFHPRVPHREMSAHWLNHDVFLQVSDFEGTSVSMLEAMAHGVVPIVTAASSGIDGVIRSQENGFVVPIGDMRAMAQAIAELANAPSLLEETGRAAYRAAQPYEMNLYARKFAGILDEVMAAEPEFDHRIRYGRFSPVHPLLLQQQQIAQQQAETAQFNQRPVRRLLKGGWIGRGRSRSHRNLRGNRHAA